jgi:hypothetical protein
MVELILAIILAIVVYWLVAVLTGSTIFAVVAALLVLMIGVGYWRGYGTVRTGRPTLSLGSRLQVPLSAVLHWRRTSTNGGDPLGVTSLPRRGVHRSPLAPQHLSRTEIPRSA